MTSWWWGGVEVGDREEGEEEVMTLHFKGDGSQSLLWPLEGERERGTCN